MHRTTSSLESDLISNTLKRVLTLGKTKFFSKNCIHNLKNPKQFSTAKLIRLAQILYQRLSTFYHINWFRFQLLLCGTGEYSIADFKANHIVNGSSPEFRRLLEWFWTTVSNFTTEEMARLLQFTTGSSQLPAEGFKELSPKFQLTPAPTFGSLPTAHTWCVSVGNWANVILTRSVTRSGCYQIVRLLKSK